MPWKLSISMINLLWFKFQQCLGQFTMLLSETSSETGVFRHLSNHVFRVYISEIQNLWGSSFFSKCLKFIVDFENAAKNSEKVFCFLDNCIWIGINKVSQLRRGYLPCTANMLTNCPKISHVNKRNVLQLNWLGSDQWIWERSCDANFNSA